MNLYHALNLVLIKDKTRLYNFSVPHGSSYDETEEVLNDFLKKVSEMKAEAARLEQQEKESKNKE